MNLRICLLLLLLVASSTTQADELQRFVIDSEQSWIRVLVYRAGLFSRLGHNHVLASNDLSGTVQCNDQVESTRVDLSFPVESLVVDLSDNRKLEGDDFAKPVSDKDINSTRKNMLGSKLLAADSFPLIRIQTTAVEGTVDSLLVTADMTVAGHTNPISFPARAVLSGNQITITGITAIAHKELGLKRFSAAFGTLKVHENITVRFEIVAVPTL